MTINVPVFFTVPSGNVRLALRRFTFSDKIVCPRSAFGQGCDAQVPVGTFPARYRERCPSGRGHYLGIWNNDEFEGGPWPDKCDACGQPFDRTMTDSQVWQEEIYVRADGQPGEYTLRDAPIGMMWDASWWPDSYEPNEHSPGWRNVGDDGVALVIRVPTRHDFMPESRASNCTLKNDGRHHCWVRHGNARENQVHIDKIGYTCAAGAGSIVTSTWHGFIHHNMVTDVPNHLV